jgi:hypothetical protein
MRGKRSPDRLQGKRSPAHPRLPLRALPSACCCDCEPFLAALRPPLPSGLSTTSPDLLSTAWPGRSGRAGEGVICDCLDPSGEVKDGAIGDWSLWGIGIGSVMCGLGSKWKEKIGTSLPALFAALLLFFLGLIYVCVNGSQVIVSMNLCVWHHLTARFMRLGGWKGVDRLASPYHLKNIDL